MDRLVDKHFPLKTIRRREDNLLWINDNSLNKIIRKKIVYKLEGKSSRWHALCQDLDEYIWTRGKKYTWKNNATR